MVPGNIHTPTTEVTGNSEDREWGAGGAVSKAKILKERISLNWNFQRGGGGVQTKKPSVGSVWIFSGTTQ